MVIKNHVLVANLFAKESLKIATAKISKPHQPSRNTKS